MFLIQQLLNPNGPSTGFIGMSGLCVFGRPYIAGVFGWCSVNFNEDLSSFFSNLLMSLIKFCVSFVYILVDLVIFDEVVHFLDVYRP